MSKTEKILEKMRNNPRDSNIENIKTIANRYGLEHRQPGTSHVTFRTKEWSMAIALTEKSSYSTSYAS